MPSRRNPDPRHVRPEVIARLRKRIDKTRTKEGWNNLFYAALAVHKSKRNVNYAKMAERNTRAAVLTKKYKMALQLAMRRQGIKNKALYEEMNQHLFDLARTPDEKDLSTYQREIFDQIEKTLTRHDVAHREFYNELKKAVEELTQ